MKQIQVRDFADDIRPGDYFGTNLALSLVDRRMDDHAYRMGVANMMFDHIQNVVDCTGQEKRKYDPQVYNTKLFDALVTVASILPWQDMARQYEVAESLEQFLFLETKPEHQKNDPQFFKEFQIKMDMHDYRANNNVPSTIKLFEETVCELDRNFCETPAAKICEIYKFVLTSRAAKHDEAYQFLEIKDEAGASPKP